MAWERRDIAKMVSTMRAQLLLHAEPHCLYMIMAAGDGALLTLAHHGLAVVGALRSLLMTL